MLQIDPTQVTPALRGLFSLDMPAGTRCFTVLDGNFAGRILTDDPASPTWAIAQEGSDWTVYFGGQFDTPLVSQILTHLRQDDEVLIGLWHDDPLNALIPANPEYDGLTLDFTDRPVGQGLDIYLQQLPADCELRRTDRDNFDLSPDHETRVRVFGSLENALTRGIGFYLMRGDELLCDTYAGPAANGIIEIGVTTMKPHEGKGYATITCARLVQECEKQGYQTWWNAAKQNLGSAAIARKLGYRQEREYRLVAWSKLK